MCESTPGYVQWSQFQMIARDAEVQMVFAGAAAIAFDSTTRRCHSSLNSPFKTLFIMMFQVINFVPEGSIFDVH